MSLSQKAWRGRGRRRCKLVALDLRGKKAELRIGECIVRMKKRVVMEVGGRGEERSTEAGLNLHEV